MIGDDIEITVIKLDDSSVKFAIKAPKSVTILRRELYKEVQEENKSASEFDIDILKNLKK